MKQILFTIALFCSLTAFCQARFFMINKSGGVSTPEYYLVDNADEYADGTQSPIGWNTYNRSAAQVASAPQTLSNLNKSNATGTTTTSTTVSFTYISGFTAVASMQIQGSNAGVFPDNVLNKGWVGSDGAQFKFSGLNNSKQYTLYVLFDSFSWEAGTQYFSVGATNSNQIAQTNNVGDNSTYPNWENDAALAKIVNITPTSNEITATIHNVSGGVPRITAVILKQQ